MLTLVLINLSMSLSALLYSVMCYKYIKIIEKNKNNDISETKETKEVPGYVSAPEALFEIKFNHPDFVLVSKGIGLYDNGAVNSLHEHCKFMIYQQKRNVENNNNYKYRVVHKNHNNESIYELYHVDYSSINGKLIKTSSSQQIIKDLYNQLSVDAKNY